MEEAPCTVSEKWAKMGDLLMDSSLLSCLEAAMYSFCTK